MEAAASIITVITLSLQSTKFIYQSTKEIRDGPSVVTELAARTRRLEETLQQLQHLVQDSSQLTRVHDTSIWEPLVRHTSQCSDTLQEMARKFKALDSSGSKDRLKKTWKGIKISLKKEDLSRSSDQMQHHIDVLGLQIGIINRYALFFTRRTPTYGQGEETRSKLHLGTKHIWFNWPKPSCRRYSSS